MKLIFFGTPDYVIPVLEALKDAVYEIAAVVTQPPKPVGRKGVLTPSSVALWAKKHEIKVFDGSPKRIVEDIKKLKPDVGILASYGRILPKELLNVFPKGILNIHPSLLPAWRGPSPIEAQLLVGVFESGIAFIKLDEEMDHGPIIAQHKVNNFHRFNNKEEARKKMFEWAAKSLPRVLSIFLTKPRLFKQNHKEATYTTLLNKDHGFIPPKNLKKALKGELDKKLWTINFIQDSKKKLYSFRPSPYFIKRFVEVMYPWPGSWTYVKINGVTKRLKILKIKLVEQTPEYDESGYDKILNHRLELVEVQLEGKNPVSWEEFKKGYPEAKFQD